jgi:glycosyltransferase 2 family protein
VSKYIRIGVSVLLLTLIAWNTDWSDVAAKFANLRFEIWFAAIGVAALGQVASARRWQFYARELRFECSLAQYCAYYFIGTYFNLLLPTSVGGDVMRVWYLNGNSGRKWEALASVFLERLNGLLVLIAFACFGVLITSVPLPSWIQASVWGIAMCAVLGVAALPVLQRWEKLPLHRRQQLQTALTLLRVPNVTAWATVMSVLVQLFGVISLWFIGLSLGLEIPVAFYFILGPMVSLLTLLPVSLNGMGVREGGTVLFLAHLHIDRGSALTLALVWFATGAAVSLAGGFIYLFGAFPKAAPSPGLANEEANEHGSVDRGTGQGREGELKKAA